MKQLEQLADMFSRWFKDMPHLPKGFTKWLAQNAWWLTIIAVVLSAIGLLTSLSAIMVGSALIAGFGAPVLGGMVFLGSLILIVVSGLSVIIEGVAISPLKAMQRRGWQLIFLSLVVSMAGAILADLVRVDVVAILFSLIVSLIGFYVLNELRTYFAQVPVHGHGAQRTTAAESK